MQMPVTKKRENLRFGEEVAAAKADEDLQNCPLIATCLADVAIGATPYLEVELLLPPLAVCGPRACHGCSRGDGSHDPSDMATEGGDSLHETEERAEKED
eukprot:s583_g17.t1